MLRKNPRDAQYPEENKMYEDERPRTGSAPSLEAAPATFDRVSRSGAPITAPAEPVVASQTPPAARAESVVDAHSSFDGRFETEQDLRIEGSISGDVVCKGRFTVEREATAKVKLQAHEAHIKGRFEGEVACSGLLVVASTAVVSGTIKAATLVVEEGASLSGAIETAKSASASTRPTTLNRDRERPSPVSEPAVTEVLNAPSRSSRSREVPSFALVSSENPDRN
jgi:cytoskeletal protein CcmA (bactofilin family)